MKNKVVSILVISALLLSGCSSKNALLNSPNKNSPASSEIQTSSKESERAEVKTNFEAVKPGTLPQLSEKQKSEVDSKIKPTVNDLKNTLKSIQDAQDIDLNSIN